MTTQISQATRYTLTGPGLEIEYSPRDGELTVESEDWPQVSGETLETTVTEERDIGTLVTAVLLPSSRNGTRVTLTLLLPETEFEVSRAPKKADATGVAVFTSNFKEVVGGPPQVLQKYEALSLEGTAFWS